MSAKKDTAPVAKKTALIKDYKTLRTKLRMNQSEFWGRLGVTQSGGSRYESGRKAPRTVAVLAHEVYIKGNELDARNYK